MFFSLFKFCLGFRGCPNILFGNELYIVIHIIYLCEKPDSVDFPRKKHQSQISAYFRYFFFLQADCFLSNGCLIPLHFQRIIAILPGFSDFPEKNVQFF